MDDLQDLFVFDDNELDLGLERVSKKRGRKLGKLEEVSDIVKVSGCRELLDG